MESTGMINEFLGSPLFTVLAVFGIIALGVMVRVTFPPTDMEYRHDGKVE
jgi:hypothetical protein